MGLNPFRPQTSRRSDIAIVVIALLAVVLLVLWGGVAPVNDFYTAGEHKWTDDDWDVGKGPTTEVRHVQPYQADKMYRCPGCDHEIRAGEGHEVVIPIDAPEDRRHWHTGCWHRESKRGSQPGVKKRR